MFVFLFVDKFFDVSWLNVRIVCDTVLYSKLRTMFEKFGKIFVSGKYVFLCFDEVKKFQICT
jgi:hypothetical protein